ncbi:hydantoinase/oxoprolinase family protein [Aestuariivirga litoralis]|uniref:hydantoinase/oxoprolinase family protein n=1 Tax=Aestuariivirga litoralis TaxID=2650924 RepID=UPI0018C51871|nr:hydantoinase/oxoprolinase family protein [Aestuariivirga litoralis]MBG1231119.1 hydantoinase/oxoprolinase family protein [Aestuariivirga litoralis]
MSSPSYIIGIDTGGTYTDAVVIDSAKHLILASAKALTTKGDLSVGVIEAMAAAMAQVAGFSAAMVKMVSVSTTLATNAVVEGHGGAVGLVLVGFDARMEERSGLAKAFPGMPILRMAGGHDHTGAQVAKLDLDALRAWLAGPAQEVSAFAVAASFAVRNPAHELAIAEVITQTTDKPVTMSHDLASALDAPRRAQTAVLNARLVSRITDLVSAVEKAMQEHGFSCPLMLVKGDGSLALAEAIAKRPIETVLSGPAASLIGAQWLSGRDDFIMSDMGGTTTDVGLLIDGAPLVAEQGSEVGGWRTMVKAIDVKTIALGGDSEVKLEPDGAIGLGPERAVPISLLAARVPALVEMLEADLSENTGGSMLGKFLVLPFGAELGREVTSLTEVERSVFKQVTHHPLPYRKVAMGSAAMRAVSSLRRRGLIQYCSFTPSDAAHVLNLQDNWSRDAAVLAARLLVRFRDMKLGDDALIAALSRAVWEKAVDKSIRVVLDLAFGLPQHNALVDVVARGAGKLGHVNVSLTPKVPVVAVGGPVKIYYPELGKRLGCEVIFTPHCDVANAIGAAAGLVACHAVAQVEGDGSGVFRVTGQGPVITLASGAAALAKASELAEAAALALAKAQGTAKARVKLSVKKHYMPEARDDDGLLTAHVTAEARGLPA